MIPSECMRMAGIDPQAVLDAALTDAAGATTSLRSHLGRRGLVVGFLRHYG